MRIEDVMTGEVATARPDTPLKNVARELIERRISGMPVVDDEGDVVGVISETDIVAKARPESPKHGRGLPWRSRHGDRDEERRHDARVAGEAMTAPAITIEPYWPVSFAARRMLEGGVNRLPVVKRGRLVGIVTRADLVRAFARSDEDIARDVREQVAFQEALWLDRGQVQVHVGEGETTLTGNVRRRSDAEVLPRIVASVPGVVSVRSELTWSEND